MSLALDAILGDVEAILEVTVEIDSAKRSDGTLKTWYYSTHIRETGPIDAPANTTFLPFLQMGGTLGPLSQSLSEDVLFSGLASNSPGSLTLLQQVVDNDQLSELNDYVFAGYPVRIKFGRVDEDDYANGFVLFRTVTVAIDPIVQSVPNGLQATFQLSSVLGRLLDEPLILKRYLGIPTCAEVLTTVPVAQASYNAAHDVTSFTLMYTVQVTSNPVADRNLIAKAISGTNLNFALIYKSSGFVECQVSIASVNTILHLSGTNLAGAPFHTIVWGLLDKTTSYLMIDGTIISTAIPSGTVNLPNAGVRMARFLVGRHVDARLYNRYIPPDEARGIAATRSDGQDLGCVGCWRFDDGGSATAVNDYSPTGADATWTPGVLNTDYRWTFSDLGEPEMAGQLYPLTIGNVLNAKAHLIDSVRERYRGNVDATGWHTSTSNTTLTVKSQGTVLTGGGTDYTAPADGGDGVFSMTTQEDEPITYDLLNTGTSEELIYPSNLAKSLLTQRTRFTSSDVANVSPMTVLCPWPSGYHTDQDATAQQAIKEILGESGMCYFEDSEGHLFIDMLLPPTGYGPYNEPCIDLLGVQGGVVNIDDLGDISGSCTICGWVKVNLADQTSYNFGTSEPNVGTAYIAAKPDLDGNYAVYFQSIGSNAGKLAFKIAGTTLYTPSGVIAPYVWHFVACTFDDSGNTMKIYCAPLGSSLAEITSGANSSSPTTNNSGIRIGNPSGFPWMSVQHLQVWNVVKNLSQLQSLMTTPPVGNESNLLVYAPLNEGVGDPVERVSLSAISLSATSRLPQWCPKLVVNLDETPSIKLTDYHHTHPSWNIITGYAKNYFRMVNSDIDAGVSQNDRLKLTREKLYARFESDSIRSRFKHAKRIELSSLINDTESANRLLKILAYRFGTNNYVGSLAFPHGLNLSRLAVGLQIGDEVGVTGFVPSQLQTPLSFRVASVSPNPLQLATNVSIWR